MKTLKIFLIISILIPVNLIAQSKREDRISQERTRNWQYESICFQSGGAGSSYLVQITSYVADMKQVTSCKLKEMLFMRSFLREFRGII